MLYLCQILYMNDRILIIGSSGQIGTALVIKLRKMYGNDNVVASDIRPSSYEVMNSGPFEELDILDEQLLRKIVKKYKITQVYLLAALLSATAEKNIELGWELNMRSHSHVLELEKGCTDESACNYRPYFYEDDGSCEYAEENYDCN